MSGDRLGVGWGKGVVRRKLVFSVSVPWAKKHRDPMTCDL
jgi:hypothetical protein